MGNIYEWLNLIFRWIHVLAGISWIGNSFYFMWLDKSLEVPTNKIQNNNVIGELWMVHSGGFYQVVKKQMAPGQMPKTLHWFKWEAALTWISGVFLLTVVYYLGGGAYLIDPAVSAITVHQATLLGVGLILLSWAVYDTLWISPLSKSQTLASIISFGLLGSVIYFLSHILSGRGAFIHVGAVLGSLMAGNVWMRIIPAQRQMIAATKMGEKPNATLGARAKMRSIHNNYMTFPLVFIMLSNHFPSTYGNKLNWLILIGLMLVGATVRHFMNTRNKLSKFLLALVPFAVMGLYWLTLPQAPITAASNITPSTAPLFDAKKVGPLSIVRGVVYFRGTLPVPKQITFPVGCAEQHRGPVYEKSVLVRDGRLQNSFIWISRGMEKWSFPAPAEEVVLDQRGCVYQPRVVGAQVGQPVVFINSDPVFHNVRTVAQGNGTFNEGMQQKDSRMMKIFSTPEIMVNAKCDVHPWMASFIGVLPHPYFAVSDSRGEFSIENVPAGHYTLSAWHEIFGHRSQDVTIVPGGTPMVDFSFE